MEVFMGPTFGIEVAASSAYARDHCPNEKKKQISSCLFDEVGGVGSDPRSPDLSSDSSSSIGSPGDSDAEDEDDDVSSGGLACLGSIEDSLPIKRGLSNHYAGKSKSFGNLSDISSVKEVPKAESPFNKKRRLLLANKWSRNRKSSFYSWQNPNSMPLLALVEDDDEDQSENNKQTPSPSPSPSLSPSCSSSSSSSSVTLAKSRFQQSNLRASFKSQSCYSLTDLQLQVEQDQ